MVIRSEASPFVIPDLRLSVFFPSFVSSYQLAYQCSYHLLQRWWWYGTHVPYRYGVVRYAVHSSVLGILDQRFETPEMSPFMVYRLEHTLMLVEFGPDCTF